MEVITFTCSICGEGSRDICIACTKDTCINHLCERCKRCSDCCVCEVRLINHHEIHHHERNGKVVDSTAEEPESTPDLRQNAPPPDESEQP